MQSDFCLSGSSKLKVSWVPPWWVVRSRVDLVSAAGVRGVAAGYDRHPLVEFGLFGVFSEALSGNIGSSRDSIDLAPRVLIDDARSDVADAHRALLRAAQMVGKKSNKPGGQTSRKATGCQEPSASCPERTPES